MPNEKWSVLDKMELLNIINYSCNCKYKTTLSEDIRVGITLLQMHQYWLDICEEFKQVRNIKDVDIKKLRQLWKKITQKI